MVLSEQLRDEKIKKATILFIDDQPKDLERYIEQVRNEGFSNVSSLDKVHSLSSITDKHPALIVLDLGNVAVNLDQHKQGLSVLEYVKERSPFTKVMIFSGTTVGVDHSLIITQADKVIKKGTVSLKDFLMEVEEQVCAYYDPVQQKEILITQIKNKQLLNSINGFWNQRGVKKLVRKIENYNDQSSIDDIIDSAEKLYQKVKPYVEFASYVAGFIALFKK